MPGSLRDSRGFSLPELIIVIVIIGLLTAVSRPAYQKFITHFEMVSATDSIKRAFNLARTRAIADVDAHYGIYFIPANPDTVRFVLDCGPVSHAYDPDDKIFQPDLIFPKNIKIESVTFPDNIVLFRGNGSARNGGAVTIRSSSGEKKSITVTARTGRIKVSSL